MAVGSINNYFMPTQYYYGLFNTNTVSSLAKMQNNWGAVSGTQKINGYTSVFNQDLYKTLGDVKTKANALQSQITSMASLTPYSVNIGKVADYSNKDVLGAEVAKGANVSAYTKTDVNVTQLAAGQTNKSVSFANTENSFGSEFGISITDAKGKASVFSVALDGSGTNQSALKAMADKINTSNIGIKATVVTDTETDTSRLELFSEKTGERDGAFTVTDRSGAGLDTVDKAAQDAKYTVNGKDFSSASNQNVKILDGVTASLNKTGETQLTYKTDPKGAESMVQKFVDSYNDFISASASSPNLSAKNTIFMSSYDKTLANVGINVGRDGKMTLDSGKLAKSIEDGSFSRSFQGYNSFGNSLYKVTRDAYSMAYAESAKATVNNFLSTSNQMGNSFISQMFNSAISYTGLLYNALV